MSKIRKIVKFPQIMGLWKYFSYVVRHKLYVTWECFKRGLIWRGVLHDIDKFLPFTFFAYARFFYNQDGTKKQIRTKEGYYKPTDTGDADFDYAWFLHQKRNDHHWQWWVFPDDGPEPSHKVIPMSEPAATEMVCDWIGAGKAQGTPDVVGWYCANHTKMILDDSTRCFVIYLMDIVIRCNGSERLYGMNGKSEGT